jgi:hypothetical protein
VWKSPWLLVSAIHALIVDCKHDHSHCFAKHSFDWSELANHLGSFSLSACLPRFPGLLPFAPAIGTVENDLLAEPYLRKPLTFSWNVCSIEK